MTYITPNQHEKNEWSRLAQDAYRLGLNSVGHKYSVAASICRDGRMAVEYFDRLQAGYRNWLVNGFTTPASDATIAGLRTLMARQ